MRQSAIAPRERVLCIGLPGVERLCEAARHSKRDECWRELSAAARHQSHCSNIIPDCSRPADTIEAHAADIHATDIVIDHECASGRTVRSAPAPAADEAPSARGHQMAAAAGRHTARVISRGARPQGI